MSRNIDTQLMDAIAGADVSLVVMAKLKFRSKTEFAWSGVGPLVWNGNTFKGVGTLGQIGELREQGEGRAEGVRLTLSGLDPDMLEEALTDVRVGGAVNLWVGAVTPELGLIGTPYMIFSGQMDRPEISIDVPTCSISLNVETRYINHGRPSQRRYTAADQRANGYPDDSAFDWVEELNDQALIWGQ